MQTFTSVGSYISSQPTEYQEKLIKIQQLIQEVAPDAVEGISYGMPGYKYCGKPLVYFACAKKHIGFYPTPSGVEHFKKKLQNYTTSKGAIQFPHDEELPLQLIKNIIEFRIKENKSKE